MKSGLSVIILHVFGLDPLLDEEALDDPPPVVQHPLLLFLGLFVNLDRNKRL